MRIAVISMVRNEADVIEAWLSHLLALFDDIFIADHLSDDGTYEFLQEAAGREPRIRLTRYEAQSYDQDVVLDALRRQALDSCDAELLFVLDADEFLPFGSSDEFRAMLSGVAEHNLMLFRWRNAYPAQSGKIGHSFDGYRALELSTYGKVAMRRHIAMDPLYKIPKGAHWLDHDLLGIVPGAEVGELLHVPVRSMDQVWRKVLQGCEAYLAIPGYDGLEGVHWIDLLETLLANPNDWELVPALVHQYGRKRSPQLMASAAEAFEPATFMLAGGPSEPATAGLNLGANTASPADYAARAQVVLSRLRRARRADGGRAAAELALVLDGRIRHPCDLVGRRFATLPAQEEVNTNFAGLIDALEAAFRDIENRSASAWGEHIPFLFALIALMRPRRYAELGVHNGTSFFAACQAIRHENVRAECIAIDNWLGDVHAGKHSPEVFAGFVEYLLDNYGEFAGFIRKNFDDAVQQFDDGSIDLLHIDGFHTVGAVRGDFEHWLAKMSDRGVVLFHDTNEFKADFGVWRFWRLAREKYPYVEFGHGHGLGVLVVGERSPLRGLLSETDSALVSPRMNELLQVIFGNLGRTSWTQLQARLDEIALRDRRIGELEHERAVAEARLLQLSTQSSPTSNEGIGALEQQLAQLRREDARLRRELAKYEGSIYGRIRRAIRAARQQLRASRA